VSHDQPIVLTTSTWQLELDPATAAITAIRCSGDAAEPDWTVPGRPELGQSFRLLTPLPDRRHNYVEGLRQDPPVVRRSEDGTSVTFSWTRVRSEHGGDHQIGLVLTVAIVDGRAVFTADVDNASDVVVENVHYPTLGDVRPPPDDELYAFGHFASGASRTMLWPHFDNAMGFCSVRHPTFANVSNNTLASVGAPVVPFILLENGRRGMYLGVDEPSAELVVWHGELHPGWSDSVGGRVPTDDELGGRQVRLPFHAVHVPFVLPGQSRRLTPVALQPYDGDWHVGADVYRARRDSWALSEAEPPDWTREPHAWQQIQVNSSEDTLHLRFDQLPAIARECVERGVRALQVTGWNTGGQDRNNPSHEAEPRLGGAPALRRAIQECQELGVKVVLFTKFVWADRSSERFRNELAPAAIKDPYGDHYVFHGFRYDTVTQLLDINTRRLVPMCFDSPAWMQACEAEFQHVLDFAPDGILNDEAMNHSPALLCFDTAHGHRYGAPVYARDRDLITRLRRRHGERTRGLLFAGEACYDWLFEEYQLSYSRTNVAGYIPLTRYLRPYTPLMVAVTGYDDRSMINQCLRLRFIASYEPELFKGRLTSFDRTVQYGQRMDAIRTELREWFWDGRFTDTVGATVTSLSGPAVQHAVYRSASGRSAGVVVVNDDTTSSAVVSVDVAGADRPYRYRTIDEDRWLGAAVSVVVPPRSAAMVIPEG